MSTDHEALMAELRALATVALDRLEPLLERAAEAAAAVADPPPASGTAAGEATGAGGVDGCAWCPVCAVVALVRGQQHDLLSLVATQLSALLALVRALLDEHTGHPAPADGGQDPGESTGASRRAFVPIPVRIDDNPTP